MSGRARIAAGRLKRLRALKRLRVQRRHLKRALLATTPATVLLGYGSMPVTRLAVPVVVAAAVPAAKAMAAEPPSVVIAEAVEASYYADEFAGRPTASGEVFDPELLTAAHRTLPLGSLVEVTEAISGRSVVVRVNDRGPFHGERIIDLSRAAAERIGMLADGTGKVTLRLFTATPEKPA
jgi:rare lipoprotein A